MRILQLGDTHLGAKVGLLGAPRGHDRAADHLRALDAALAPALRGEVDLVVHTGDAFDRSRPPAAAVLAAAERLVRVARQVPVLVIAGNHDRRGLQRYVPHRLPGLRVVDRPEQVRLGGLRIAAVPFVRRADDWAAAAATCCAGGVDVLVAHQAFDGDRVPGFRFAVDRQSDTIGERHLPPGVRWVMAGHLHPRQAVQLGGCEVVHAGSTERTAFSEADQVKGTVLWDWQRRVTWRYADLSTRPMVWVRGPADLDRIGEGTWVGMAREAPEAWVTAASARGGWVSASVGGFPERKRPENRGSRGANPRGTARREEVVLPRGIEPLFPA